MIKKTVQIPVGEELAAFYKLPCYINIRDSGYSINLM